MEFRILSYQERRRLRFKRLNVWHRWFAWRPIRLDDETIVWFKRVMRKCRFNTYNLSIDTTNYARIGDPDVKEGSQYP